MANQEQEGVAHTDHSGDEQRREINNLNVNKRSWTSRGVQNIRPHPHTTNPGGRRIPSTIDKRWSGKTSHNTEQRQSPSSRPFRGIGSEEFRITQQLRHRMQSIQHGVRELRKENLEL
ncbi:hypothetical protein PIB30_090059 [Stylosanthes scabra]|uniref:Uncharacterized protein n=1 Tax=Stylosanthes scabra TaxID=79078 RepID=A0ABU6RU49_9FABA|nr:hypothetical protein [Stylosanthes scabra]